MGMNQKHMKAPFNFVPVSNTVITPDWSGKISQDIPFSDGVSGWIDLKVTAKTPIFVRNGHTRDDAENKTEEYLSFSKLPDGRFFIPGTTMKGCVRSVLEIMSFSKLHLDENAMFAQREWDNNDLYPLKKEQLSFHCGYLKEENGKYVIEDHDKPYRISHIEIDRHVNNVEEPFKKHFSKTSGFDLNKEHKENVNGETISFDPKTAAYKYFLVGDDTKLRGLTFSESNTSTEYSTRLKVNPNGNIKGSIVLTGQPDQWMDPRPTKMTKGAGKFYEFVFPDEIVKTYNISEETYQHFKFIYVDSPDWKRAKNLLNTKGIPVFFRLSKGGIKDFGLAYLYKLPYEKSPYETLSGNHKKKELDLAECIFGQAEKDSSLKGRVQFGNFISENGKEMETLRLVLGSPKASYYPIYISQKTENRGHVTSYSTYNDSTISGWKRYHVRKSIYSKYTGNDKIDTLMKPLEDGAVFEGKVRFHNLREVELGALLSALTFHHSEGCYHQIGQGKPYGLGKTQFETTLHITSQNNPDSAYKKDLDYMADFEDLMVKNGISNWATCEQMKNLFTLSHEEITANDAFDYMIMDNDSEKNEFLQAKKFAECLTKYEALIGKVYYPTSLLTLKEDNEKKADAAKENEINNLYNDAKALYGEGKYAEAKNLYEKVQSMGRNCQTEILNCNEQIKRANSGITDLIRFTKDAKIGTISGQMRKYLLDHAEISEEDCKQLGQTFQGNFGDMKKAEQRKWLEEKNWKPIADVIGAEKAGIIFSYIKA